jgi:hypothetical protein
MDLPHLVSEVVEDKPPVPELDRPLDIAILVLEDESHFRPRSTSVILRAPTERRKAFPHLVIDARTRFEDEFVEPGNGPSFHVFAGFALVNRLLCSAGPKRSSEGHPAPTMFGACLEHFTATKRILEPTIVIMQGSGLDRRTQGIFERRRSFSENLHGARFEGSRVLLCTFTHPSAHGALRWGDRLDAPYLTDVVVPTLEEAVQLL